MTQATREISYDEIMKEWNARRTVRTATGPKVGLRFGYLVRLAVASALIGAVLSVVCVL